jgi:hypothetical protein
MLCVFSFASPYPPPGWLVKCVFIACGNDSVSNMTHGKTAVPAPPAPLFPSSGSLSLTVSEHMGWVCNVVLMNVYFGSGKPQGVGISGGEGPDGQMRECKGRFMSNPREKWTDPVTVRRVPSKWKRELGEQGDYRVHNLSILCI